MFKLLTVELEKVQCGRTPARFFSTADLKSVENALDNVDYFMDFLSWLVQSPCFWKYLRQPVLQEWVLKQAGAMIRKSDEVHSFLALFFWNMITVSRLTCGHLVIGI